MILQVWHTFLLGRIIQDQPGWMGSIGVQPFSDLSRDNLLCSGLNSSWATPGPSETLPNHSCFLGGMLLVVVLLKCKPLPQPEILCRRRVSYYLFSTWLIRAKGLLIFCFLLLLILSDFRTSLCSLISLRMSVFKLARMQCWLSLCVNHQNHVTLFWTYF